MRTTILSICLLAGLAGLTAGRAQAAIHSVCLRLPVTLDDETGKSTEVGTTGNWKARGIFVTSVLDPNGLPVLGFPTHADADGCFPIIWPTAGNYTVEVGSTGLLGGDNVIYIRNDVGQVIAYQATVHLTASNGTTVFIWPGEHTLLRMYALYAYAIEEGFRGSYSDELLDIWWKTSGPCGGCNQTCDDGESISICSANSRSKFVMIHEYGHANLARTVGFTNDCSLGGSSHSMRGLEFDSCAAMEGWAHFVAADVWNNGQHDGGDPTGWFRYLPGGPVINVENGQGGCFDSTDPSALDYRRGYGDACLCTVECFGTGVEADWMRFWWDYHTDGDAAGSRPGHSQLQDDIDSAGGWDSADAWIELRDGLDGVQGSRFRQLGDWNGVSYPF